MQTHILRETSLSNIMLSLIVIFSFIIVLFSYDITIPAALGGLTLWHNNVLPACFPAMILTSLMIELKAATLASRLFYPITRRILGISLSGTFCFITAICCGYPVGIKCVCDLLKKKEITDKEATSLLSISSYPSPMYLIGFIYPVVMKKSYPLWMFLFSIYAPCVLLKVISDIVAYFHNDMDKTAFYKKNANTGLLSVIKNIPVIAKRTTKLRKNIISYETMDQIITSCALLQLKIASYMMLFSILASLIIHYIKTAPALAYFLGGCCEMTIGSTSIIQFMPIEKSLPVICFFLSFGGLCTLFQTISILKGTKLSVTTYVIYKLLHGSFSAICMYFLMQY